MLPHYHSFTLSHLLRQSENAAQGNRHNRLFLITTNDTFILHFLSYMPFWQEHLVCKYVKQMHLVAHNEAITHKMSGSYVLGEFFFLLNKYTTYIFLTKNKYKENAYPNTFHRHFLPFISHPLELLKFDIKGCREFTQCKPLQRIGENYASA